MSVTDNVDREVGAFAGQRGATAPSPASAALWLVPALAALPIAYWFVLATPGQSGLPAERLLHLTLNLLCNLAVVIAAWSAHGETQLKIGRMLNAALLFHGALALFTLGTRFFFSRPVMFVAFGASLVLGLLAVYLRHRVKGFRIAIVGAASAELIGATTGRVIHSPDEDLRAYDLILLPMQNEMSAPWSASVARAMLAGAEVRHVAEYLEETRGQTSLAHFHLDHLSDRTLTSYQTLKRILDIALVVFFLPAILPLTLGALGAVRLTMGGPALFIQERVGRGGKPFRMYKIRTMRIATAGVVSATTVADDRITRLGRFLRRTRLDELPQMINVLKGDMSLIGPRPEWTPLYESILRDLPDYAYRQLVRPGISGWAQVRSGYAAELAETRVKLSFDLYYVKHCSLALDLQILARTVWTLIGGKGAR